MKRYLFLFICLLLIFSMQGYGQKQGQALVDSLLQELPKAKDDTNKVNLLHGVSFAKSSINPDEGIKFGLQALELATKLEWKKGMANANNSLGTNFANKSDFKIALEYYLKALKIDEEIGNKKGIASNTGNIGNLYRNESDYPKALEYFLNALKINEEIGNKSGEAAVTNGIGSVYENQSDYPKALEYFFKALKISEDIRYKTGILAITNNIGNVYQAQSDYPKALEYFFKALKICEEVEDKGGITLADGNIGCVYVNQKDYRNALEYFFKALKIAEETGNKNLFGYNTGNIGSVYKEEGDYRKALEYFFKSLEIEEKIGDKYGISNAIGNIGIVYELQGSYPKSLEYDFKALKIEEEIRDKDQIGITLENIGEDYLLLFTDTKTKINFNWKFQQADIPVPAMLKNKAACLKEAIIFLERGLRTDKEINAAEEMQRCYENLAKAYKKMGDYKKSLEYADNYHAIKDSLFSNENTKKIMQMGMQYSFDKKQDSIKVENEKYMALAAQTSSNKIKGIILTGVSLIIIGFLLVYFYRKRENYKFQQQITAVRQEALNAQMSDHFIGNAMDSIKGFIENNEKEKASEYLVLFNRLIRKVLENSFKKQVPLYEELEVLNMYIALEKLRFPQGALRYEITVDKELDAENTFIPPMILQVLSENAIKHGFNKAVGGILKIKVEKKGAAIACTVEDNGIGRQAVVHSKSEAGKKRISFGGSLAEKLINASSGVEWKSFYKITDLLDGNGNATGTRVEFTLPFIFEAQS